MRQGTAARGGGDRVPGQFNFNGLSAIKLSEGGKEAVYVGTMDEDTQTMTNLVEPLVGGSPQLLDAATCA